MCSESAESEGGSAGAGVDVLTMRGGRKERLDAAPLGRMRSCSKGPGLDNDPTV